MEEKKIYPKQKQKPQKKNVFLEIVSEKFVLEKQKYMSELNDPLKFDKSRAGGVDKDIKNFNETINSKSHIFTTSSCAGSKKKKKRKL